MNFIAKAGTLDIITEVKMLFKMLKSILDVQEFDMKMIRLMRLKKERQNELAHIDALKKDLESQLKEKELEIENLNKDIAVNENKIAEVKEKLKKLEVKQGTIKKVEEFNALTQEMTSTERERVTTEQATSDLIDKRNAEEEILAKIKNSLALSEESSKKLEEEIKNSINLINEEGKVLKTQREALAINVDQEILKIYSKLLSNKKDRVIVPIENRTCSGCHIALTAHLENLVRKGERLIFCEHCSRILYWPESQAFEDMLTTKKRRKRIKT